ncbi:uncharacterized protein M421DRAFT_388398 [Didymella exigua CBS 183.55]|uniref:RRM domain-containing protein n=1 Tax=Didymella exigua CBS 183.55 TaxID=1150837 RepID=A0A6A5S251_9PLEO|nr:uncharacterized protein M421DRAFT_388398 [Didymella exigua CBS 183.55]KAF1933983.1 hypothetical protein M421DRAFT_388398 [Didymella exigua CBS 183.55]
MSYVTSWKEGDGDFLLVVAGLTRFAPYLSGWQEFKDHIRKVVREQPGWVDVYASQSQRRGEMQGWCRLKDKEDADAAYKIFYRSKGMLVHVWQTRRSSDGFRLMKCNCSVHFPEVAENDHSAGLCGIDIGRVNQLGGKPYTAAPAQYMAVQPGYSYPVFPATTSYAIEPVYATQVPQILPMMAQSPVYSASNSGMPVNIRDGAMLTEARGIFIQNLSYKVGSDELRNLLYTVGRPVYCKVHRDRSGVSKGVATAKFASTHEAQLAVTHLNRKPHRGMALKVRLDQDTTVVGQVGPPLVVNGSVGAYK